MTRTLAHVVRITVVALSLAPSAARAQAACASASQDPAVTARRWSPPLDRVISLHERGVSLRDALDRLAAAARLRLAYSAELLPLDRRVCVSYRSVPAGVALTTLLEGTDVEPVVTDSDRVVLAPVRTPATSPPGAVSTQRAGVLERVVVTGTVNGSAHRGVPVALDVVDGRELARQDARTLSSVLNGSVPGVWVWEQAPTSLLARYASIRGASSFGISYPKVYVDGIEVANSLLVTELDVESVERVEVIRGPQGAALYGADAISGVINIVTRHDGIDGGAPRAQLQTGAGAARSAYSSGSVLTQRHTMTLRAGSGVQSGALGFSISTLGDFIPDAYDRRFAFNGSARRVGARAIISASGRFLAEDAAAPTSPVLASIGQIATLPGAPPDTTPNPGPPPLRDSTYQQSVRQYALATTATIRGSSRWTHTAVMGLDGYELDDASAPGTPFTSAADSALRAAQGSATRGTVRVSSVAQLGASDRSSGTLTLALEHSAVREESRLTTTFGPQSPEGDMNATEHTVNWRSNTGIVTQANASWRDALFVTGGVRVEHNGGAQNSETTSRATSWMGMRGSANASDLSSEEQSGVEGGVDVLFARGVAVHVTRFDQIVSGLIQPVAVSSSGGPPPPGGGGPNDGRRIAYELQNVGEITNRGWEISGSAAGRGLSVSTALSFVDSRVRRLAPGYSGDLRAGDRMLEVPERTASVTTSYSRGAWFASVTACSIISSVSPTTRPCCRVARSRPGCRRSSRRSRWLLSFRAERARNIGMRVSSASRVLVSSPSMSRRRRDANGSCATPANPGVRA